jgi:diguanylate cyclase (GGDEF)-like protein
MKILGVRLSALGAARSSAPATRADVSAPARPVAVDSAGFLGLSETDLTGPVQAALATLLAEIDDLRHEVGRLKARLNEAEELADQDVLTPLLNRRAFLRELRRVLAFVQRYGGPASLIYFDLDGLKAVNDRFGHAAGDLALTAVAERLASNVRESDIVGRVGGDEFAVILVHADQATALAKAESLAGVVEGEPVSCGDWLVPIKISYGVGEILAGAAAEQVVAEADRAMYARKRLAAAGSGSPQDASQAEHAARQGFRR